MRRSEQAGPPGRGDGGYVTAEAAMVIPALVTVAALLIWGLMAAAAQIRCVDAARAGARAAARSETPADVLRAARAAAPEGARVSVRKSGGLVRVRVTVARPRFPVTLTDEAAALDEDTVEGGDGP
jgi:TadE-like protein